MGKPVRQKGRNSMAFEALTVAGAAKGQRKPESKKLNLESWAKCLILIGADDRNRTGDLRITNALLYRLSYSGSKSCALYIASTHWATTM